LPEEREALLVFCEQWGREPCGPEQRE